MSCHDGDQHVPDLSVATAVGTVYSVRWIDVPDRDAAEVSIRNQFDDDEITRSRKLEGQWWGNGGAYFVASYARFRDGSDGTTRRAGLVLHPGREDRHAESTLRHESAARCDGTFDGPDNITVSHARRLDPGRGRPRYSASHRGFRERAAYPLARNQTTVAANSVAQLQCRRPDRCSSISQAPTSVRLCAITGPWRRGVISPRSTCPSAPPAGSAPPSRSCRGWCRRRGRRRGRPAWARW